MRILKNTLRKINDYANGTKNEIENYFSNY